MKPSIAFIGLGIMGNRMLGSMQAHGGFNLAFAWDPDPAACQAAARQYDSLRIGATVDEIITANDTDVVYIACPPATHRQYAMAAIDAGKAVYCEKPLGVDVTESRELVEAVEAAGVINAVNFSLATSRSVEEIEARLKDGTVGDVAGMDVRLHFSNWPRDWQAAAVWLAERAEGGYVREVFSHFAYVIERLLGPAKVVSASTRYPADPALCETHFWAQLDCGGVPVSVAGGSGGVGPDRVEAIVWGSKKSYRVWDWYKLTSSSGGDWTDELAQHGDLRENSVTRRLDNVLHMLNGEPHVMPPFRTALSVQELVEEILSR